MTESVLLLAEAAAHLHVSPKYILRKTRAGEWPCHRIGNRVVFTESDLEAILAATAVPESVALAESTPLRAVPSRPRKRYPTWDA